MAKRLGRPIAPLDLSAEERAYLERQVRRHRVPRSFSDRCRMILRCATACPARPLGLSWAFMNTLSASGGGGF